MYEDFPKRESIKGRKREYGKKHIKKYFARIHRSPSAIRSGRIVANFKRKRSKRQVRCTMCTPWRWLGNHKERHKAKDRLTKQDYE
jgi:hypothetical protein